MAQSTIRERLTWEATPESYRQIRRLWIKHSIAEDGRDLDGLIDTLAEDCVYEVIPTGQRWEGHDGARAFYQSFLGAFPDAKFNLIDIVIGPQGVIEVAEMTGTHDGAWAGLPATRRPVRLLLVIHFPWDQAAERFAGEGVFRPQRPGLAAGMQLLDVGCGPGRVTIPAARRVGPAGSTVAIDIQSGMLREVEQRVAASGRTNVHTVLAGAGQAELEGDFFDRALLVGVLGEIPEQEPALREIYEAVKPGGILSITEIFPNPHYQSRRKVRHLTERVGFQAGQAFGSVFAFTLNFVKPDISPRQAVSAAADGIGEP